MITQPIRLALLAASPVYYQAPLYRRVAADPRIDFTAIFASNGGLRPTDVGYGHPVTWDIDMMQGYRSHFLRRADTNSIGGSFISLHDLDIVGTLRRGDYDVLWIHGYRYLTHQLAAITQVIRRRPILIREEQTLLHRRALWKQVAKQIGLRLLLRQSYGLYIGTQNRRWLEYYGIPAKRLFFTPYCVDNERFQAAAQRLAWDRGSLKRDLGIPDHAGPIILTVARLIPKKQPLFLLEAFRRVRQNYPCTLLIVGSGELESELRAYIQDQAIPDVVLAGFLNQSEVPKAYACADVFVLASAYDETWGLATNEAMNFGLPVVVSDKVGCGEDLVRPRENGVVVPSDDPQQSLIGSRSWLRIPISALASVLGHAQSSTRGITTWLPRAFSTLLQWRLARNAGRASRRSQVGQSPRSTSEFRSGHYQAPPGGFDLMINGSRILVAGGAGFIGRRLCRRLAGEGHQVFCIDNFCTSDPAIKRVLERDGIHVIEADVTSAPDGIFDAVYHLASPASPIHYRRLALPTMWANALGTRRLLDLSVASGASFLLASTSEVYGDPLVHPQTEDYFGNVNPIGERACYDESKRFAEALTAEYRRVHGANARIVRIFNTYGPGMALHDGRAVPAFVTAGLCGNDILIQGDGQQTRSFCYVDDLVEGLIAIGQDRGSDGRVYNLGNPEEITIFQLAELIRDLTEGRSKIRHVGAAPDDPHRRKPDITRVQRDYGWTPKMGLADGLRCVVADIATRMSSVPRDAFSGEELSPARE